MNGRHKNKKDFSYNFPTGKAVDGRSCMEESEFPVNRDMNIKTRILWGDSGITSQVGLRDL